MKRYIITAKFEGDRKTYYYAKVGHSTGTTKDPFMSELFQTLSGVKSMVNMLNMNHPTLFSVPVTWNFKQVKLTVF